VVANGGNPLERQGEEEVLNRRRDRGIESVPDGLESGFYTGEDGGNRVKTASPSVRVPVEAFVTLGRLTTAIASGDRDSALLAVDELRALLAGG